VATLEPPLLLLLALGGTASVLLLLLCLLLLGPAAACNAAAAPLLLLLLRWLDITALKCSLCTVGLLLLLHAASSSLAMSAVDRLQPCFTSCGHSCQTKALRGAAAAQASTDFRASQTHILAHVQVTSIQLHHLLQQQ
jgi:hypothetical protein